MVNENGLIVKAISGEYTILNLNNNALNVCKPRGVFRYKGMAPKVGDYVNYDDKNIISIEERKNDLIRPNVANIDKVLLVFSVKDPILNLNLLDRLLAFVSFNDIEAIIVFTKLDLLSSVDELNEYEKVRDYYKKIGYKVYESRIDKVPNEIENEIKSSISCLAGQSGVGKSTLLNLFDKGLKLKTDDISKALGRGKHTTRHIELLPLFGGFIIDTPGFGTIDFIGMKKEDLAQSFKEFFEYSKECKYGMCLHINEPNCKVKEKLLNNEILKTRYDNYLLFIDEIMGQRVVYRKNDGKKEIKK